MSDFNKNLIVSAYFRKTVKYKTSWKSGSRISRRQKETEDEQTDGQIWRS